MLGTFGAVPALAAWQLLKEKQARPDAKKLAEAAAYSTLGMLGLTGARELHAELGTHGQHSALACCAAPRTVVVGTLKLFQLDRAGMEDRVYRLHSNAGQRRTDTFAQVIARTTRVLWVQRC